MAPRSHTLIYDSAEDHKGIALVATYCGLQDQVDATQSSEGLCLTSADGQRLHTFNSICRYLASSSTKSKQLLGDTHSDRAAVQEWLSFRNTELQGLSEAAKSKVNQRLQTKVHLAGLSVSLADLVMFAALHRALINIPSAQRIDRYPNLFRWFDFMQHTIDSASHYKRIDIRKPKFQRAPATPAMPKAEKPKTQDSKPSPSSSSTVTAQPSHASPASVQAPADGISKSKSKGRTAAQTGTSPEATAITPAVTAPPASSATTNGAAPVTAATPPQQEASYKKEKKKESKAVPAAAKKAGDEPSVDMLDIRVGQIVQVEQHPNADSLFVEQIDLGEDKPRQVVSGLVKFVPVDQMQNRRVIVVTNLKPAKMRDVMSYGMVLCASNDAHDQVEPIMPPDGAPVGEKITFEGYSAEPEAQLNPKRKIYEKISPDLTTNADGVAQYKSVPFMTTTGSVVSKLRHAAVK